MKRLTAALIVILMLAAGLGVTAHILIDRSTLKENVIAAVKRQTGRDLTMARFSVGILPWPSVSAHEVTLLDENGNGVSPMLQVRDIRASIAILPLVWREIRLENLTLVRGTIALHRDETGEANWIFREPVTARDSGSGQAHGHSSRSSARWKLLVGSARMDHMVISLDDQKAHLSGSLAMDKAEFDGLFSTAPYLDIYGHRGEIPFRLNGHIGSLSLFQGENPRWAVSLGATLGKDIKQQDWLNFDGQITDTRHLHGFSGVLRGELASLKNLEAIFPNANLPELTGLGGEVGIFDADPQAETLNPDLSWLGINHLHVHVNGMPAWHGVSLTTLHADADTLSSALMFSAVIQGMQPNLALQGQLGTLAQAGTAWQSGLTTPLAVSVDLRDPAQIGTDSGLKLHVSGQIGMDESSLMLEGQARTLDVMQTTLHDLALKGNILRHASGAVQLKGVNLASRELNGVVDASLDSPVFSSLDGKLHLERINLDALSGLWSGRPTAEADGDKGTAKGPGVPGPANLLVAQNPSKETSSPSAQMEQGQDPGFFKRFLDQGRVSVDVVADTLRFNRADYTGVSGHLGFDAGRLTLDSIKGTGNGMTLSGRAVYDANTRPASISVVFSPLLFPATLAQNLLTMPDLLRGPLMAVGQLDAKGETKAAMFATLNGHLGLSMVGGTIDATRLGPYLGNAAQALLSHRNLPVRCLGLHARFANGEAQLDTIGMEAGPLSLAGHGVYGLAAKTLDLHLLPRVGFGGTGASTPVSVSGTLDAPKVRQEASEGGRFQVTIGGSEPDTCPGILSAARENVEGEAAPERKAQSQASELLRGLGILH